MKGVLEENYGYFNHEKMLACFAVASVRFLRPPPLLLAEAGVVAAGVVWRGWRGKARGTGGYRFRILF